MFAAIFVSVFLNFLALNKRRNKSVSFAPVLALVIEVFVLLAFPVHATYPLLVTVSTCAVILSGSLGKQYQPRVPFLVACMLLSAIVAVSAMSSLEKVVTDNADTSTLLILQAVVVVVCVLATFLLKRTRFFFWLKNVIPAILTGLSVMIVKSVGRIVSLNDSFGVSACMVVSSLAVLAVVRKTMSTNVQFSIQFASWSLAIVATAVSPVWTVSVADSTHVMPLLTSLINAYLLRHCLVGTAVAKDKTDAAAEPEPIASTLSRRKVIASSSIELKPVVHVDAGEFEVAVSGVSTASSSRTESLVISAQPAVTVAEIESDEDEVFRRITTISYNVSSCVFRHK